MLRFWVQCSHPSRLLCICMTGVIIMLQVSVWWVLVILEMFTAILITSYTHQQTNTLRLFTFQHQPFRELIGLPMTVIVFVRQSQKMRFTHHCLELDCDQMRFCTIRLFCVVVLLPKHTGFAVLGSRRSECTGLIWLWIRTVVLIKSEASLEIFKSLRIFLRLYKSLFFCTAPLNGFASKALQ